MNSKAITHADDASKEFIIKCFKGESSHGFDVDAVHFLNEKYGNMYYIFEYLKDENKYVSPHNSDPKYYPWNWKKFYSLYKLTTSLHGKLWLINYSDGYKSKRDHNGNIISYEPLPSHYLNEVRVMEVCSFDLDLVQQYDGRPRDKWPKPLAYMTFSLDHKYTFEQYSSLLRDINHNSIL